MLLFLIIVNIFYIILELYFNVSLLNVVSSSSDINDIHSLELFGRALSSFGFTFIFWKIISLRKSISFKNKIGLIVLVTALSYPIFYYGQLFFINHFSNNASSETKQNSYILTLVKEGIKDGVLDLNIKPYNSSNFQSENAKTFTVLNSVFLLYNHKSLDFIHSNLTQLSYNIFALKASKESEKNYEKTIDSLKINGNRLWRDYSSSKDKISEKYTISSQSMVKNYSKINSNVKLLWSDYKRWNDRYSKSAIKYYDISLEGYLMLIPKCLDELCIKKILNENERSLTHYDQNKNVKSSTFRMDSDVSMKRQDPRTDIYSIQKICSINTSTGRAIYNVRENGNYKKYNFPLKSNAISGISCNVNRDEMKVDFILNNRSQIINNMHTLNFNHSTISSFLQDKSIQNFIDRSSIKETGFSLPHPFPVNNQSSFESSLNINKKDIIGTTLSNTIKDKMGIELSGKLDSRQALISSEGFKNIIKKELGDLYFDDLNENISKKEFMLKFTKKMATSTTEKFLNDYKNTTNYSPEGNLQVKAIIVPPIALFLSLLFTIINSGILIITVTKIIIKNKAIYNKILIFMIFLILTLIFSPFFIENSFTKDNNYKTMLTKVKSENFIIGYAVDWTMRTEPIVINTIEIFKLNKITEAKQ